MQKKKAETKVFGKDVVTVRGTGKSKHIPKGEIHVVHKLHADRLLKKKVVELVPEEKAK